MSAPHDPRDPADADPPTEVVTPTDESTAPEPPIADTQAEPDSAGPTELHDADPPTEVVPEACDALVESASSADELPRADDLPAALLGQPEVEELHDVDPPTEAVAADEPRDVDPPTDLASEPAEVSESEDALVESASPADELARAADLPAELVGQPEVDELHDADPPTGAVAEEAADEPRDVDPPTDLVSESGELHDADPPTEVVPEAGDALVEPASPAEEVPRAADLPAEMVGQPEIDGLHDADPPSEVVADEAPGDMSAEMIGDPPTEQADNPAAAVLGEPMTTAGAEELHDADPPTEEIESEELPQLDDDELEKALEALLLVVDTPVEEDVLANSVGVELARVTGTLERMAAYLGEHQRGFDLRRAGGGWRYYTRDKYAPYVEKMLLDGQRAKLTRAALETLAVIAYRQPVTRARVAAVRGVNCDGVIRTLLARGLVEETGTDLETGGYLYRTTELFLERLGLSSLEDLPPIAPLLPEVDSIDDV